ncbi:MAG: excisionase family DNA-binding protein [Propionicimonas sp.]|nr:excisionase family DNA-binding protein [Propionicimonas sp.]
MTNFSERQIRALPLPSPFSGQAPVPTPEWVSLQQAAGLHGVSVDTLRRRIREGRLPAYRFGDRLIKVRIADLDNLFRPIPVGQQLRRRVS